MQTVEFPMTHNHVTNYAVIFANKLRSPTTHARGIPKKIVRSECAKLIRYDTRCYFNVRSKADISQLNLPHGTDN